ncbi:adenosylmethionine--8-amino-7-oxononanoate transaminase [Candidatus Endobugula sertula]|uniref:Adenosylmethionine-8-amino-7-oxononanoate aminotransferase n=1 Tax=Candidatus Endobugula sertula TaxID=62101 RepID=A0A1D2QMQ7_9GAMM|nr:adenosylmethionine--8-amino-7-oxononanoate transaminase [Candidatus Endobugula sertula]
MDLDFDRQHIWHPYSSMTRPDPVFPVKKAEGVYLYLEDGRRLVDGMSSWWSALHGYNHPTLNTAAIDQINTMSHVMFGGLTHEPAIKLCKQLVKLTPKPLQKVFLVDSGSIAVEVAIKMSLQFWQAQGKPEKHRLLSLRNGYHGDTFAAMSVCDPVTGMHHIFGDRVTPQIFSESPQCRFDEPWDERYIKDFRQKIEHHYHELAAVILEPIVQGAGGMRFYSPHYLKRVREICDEYELLLIADEIATGFGRTGKWFACEHADISPDILCLGKAMTAGMMTLAATLCTEKVSNIICQGEANVLMHGPTFMGNPLACVVANASINLLLNTPWQMNIRNIEQQLIEQLSECKEMSGVKDVRCLGGIGVVELEQTVTLKQVQPWFVDEGIWVRPFGRLIYIMPPFIISPDEIQTLTSGIKKVIYKITT